ncbi:MAG: hypothetical protein A4E28_00119 [Methanocella sp. PtaU1.Bin125]|nr:MAG: hypothetical protein A4E28_00119 [Methanocella sp. PtaU1.Bin125]
MPPGRQAARTPRIKIDTLSKNRIEPGFLAFYEILVGFARREASFAAFGGPFVLPLARSAATIDDMMGELSFFIIST